MSNQYLSEGIQEVLITPSGGAQFHYGDLTSGANDFQVNANLVTLQFTGDHSTVYRYRENGITGSMGASNLDVALFDACGVTAVTGGLPVGRTNRFYPQLGTYPLCELEVHYFVTNSDGTDTDFILTIFLAKIQQWVPGQAGNIAVQPTTLAWSATKTLVDVTDASLPGVTDVPVSYALDEVA